MRLSGVLVLCVAACGRIGFDTAGRVGDADDGVRLRLDAPTAPINVGSAYTFSPTGGIAPYVFSIDSGDGWISSEGELIAPHHAGSTVVRVEDSTGSTATATITYRGDRLVLAGGLRAAPVETVYTSSDGITWTLAGALPAPRANGMMVVYRDHIYYVGGLDAGSGPSSDVFRSADGVTWSRIGALPGPRTAAAISVHAGKVWLIAGYSGVESTEVYTSVDLVSWTQVGDLPNGRHELDAVSRGDRLHVIGGHDANGFVNDTYATTDGAVWTHAPNALTFATDFASLAVHAGRIVRVCGVTCDLSESTTDLETWSAGASVGVALEGAAMIGFADQIWLFGGGTNAIRSTPSDGSQWTVRGALPVSLARTGVVQFTPP